MLNITFTYLNLSEKMTVKSIHIINKKHFFFCIHVKSAFMGMDRKLMDTIRERSMVLHVVEKTTLRAAADLQLLTAKHRS